jgi:hypothetical protein
MGTGDDLPDTDWVAQNHWCVPLYYAPAETDLLTAGQAGEEPAR